MRAFSDVESLPYCLKLFQDQQLFLSVLLFLVFDVCFQNPFFSQWRCSTPKPISDLPLPKSRLGYGFAVYESPVKEEEVDRAANYKRPYANGEMTENSR